jgi:hypothetical protein
LENYENCVNSQKIKHSTVPHWTSGSSNRCSQVWLAIGLSPCPKCITKHESDGKQISDLSKMEVFIYMCIECI